MSDDLNDDEESDQGVDDDGDDGVGDDDQDLGGSRLLLEEADVDSAKQLSSAQAIAAAKKEKLELLASERTTSGYVGVYQQHNRTTYNCRLHRCPSDVASFGFQSAEGAALGAARVRAMCNAADSEDGDQGDGEDESEEEEVSHSDLAWPSVLEKTDVEPAKGMPSKQAMTKQAIPRTLITCLLAAYCIR